MREGDTGERIQEEVGEIRVGNLSNKIQGKGIQ